VDAEVNKDNYQQEVVENPLPTVVDFWGPQCARCLELMPAMEKIAQERKNEMRVVKIDATKNRRLCMGLKLMRLPAFIASRRPEVGGYRGRITESDLRGPSTSSCRCGAIDGKNPVVQSYAYCWRTLRNSWGTDQANASAPTRVGRKSTLRSFEDAVRYPQPGLPKQSASEDLAAGRAPGSRAIEVPRDSAALFSTGWILRVSQGRRPVRPGMVPLSSPGTVVIQNRPLAVSRYSELGGTP
jgi:thioredoxin 1